MFWLVLALVVGALSMLKLGALSVWVKVLSGALAVGLAAAVLVAGALAWRRFTRSTQRAVGSTSEGIRER
jgi:hypothetical protein